MKLLQAAILPVSIAALLLPPLAVAEPAPGSEAVDVRRERLRAKREQQFRAADTDGSRSLTRAEIEAAKLPAALLRRFDEIDVDGDGALTPEELEAAHARRVHAAVAGEPDDAQ